MEKALVDTKDDVLWKKASHFSNPCDRLPGMFHATQTNAMNECPLRKDTGRGFSLIEVLMAMAFTSFLLTGMAELVLRSVQAKKATDENLRRTARLSAKLENFKALPFEAEDLRAGEYQAEVKDPSDGTAERLEWQIEDRGFNAKRIDLRISLEHRPDRILQAVLLVSGFLGF
jgi:prepilin-type N-terminal cleavage/methylation domain-containing protein